MNEISYWVTMLIMLGMIAFALWMLYKKDKHQQVSDALWRNDMIRLAGLVKADTLKEFTRHETMVPPPSPYAAEEFPTPEDREVEEQDREDFPEMYSMVNLGPEQKLVS